MAGKDTNQAVAVQRFKSKIRGRHYSIRTETAYFDWVRRFMAFHGYTDPKNRNRGMKVTKSNDSFLSGRIPLISHDGQVKKDRSEFSIA